MNWEESLLLPPRSNDKKKNPNMATASGKSPGAAAPTSKNDDIRKMGYLKKLKTGKKKFFVLRGESDLGVPRLEYYDAEKKFKAGLPSKRHINLRTCFNINRKVDTKHKHVISLFTKDDCFSVVLESDADLQAWLSVMLELQQGREYMEPDAVPKINYQHVWQGSMKERSLGKLRPGPTRICLTSRTLTLIRPHIDEPPLEYELTSLRQCGYSGSFFHFMSGRSTPTGAGEMWVLMEDPLIAQSVHDTVLNAMKGCAIVDQIGWIRNRSYSNESSNPICVAPGRAASVASGASSSRSRADSVPGRPRASPGGGGESDADTSATSATSTGSMTVHPPPEQPRSKSVHSGSISCSPPYTLSPVGSLSRSSYAPNSDGSFSFDEGDMPADLSYGKYGHSLSEDIQFQPPIVEEMESLGSEVYMAMAPVEQESRRSENKVDYMDMNPSAQLDLSAIPRKSSVVSPTTSSSWKSQPMNSPPSFLAIGEVSSAVKALNPTPLSAPSSNADDYLEMASPAGNSATADTPDGYMPMSPVGSLYSSSQSGRPRTASTHMSPEPFPTIKSPIQTPDGGKETIDTETEPSGDGYVPMAPVKDSLASDVKRQSPQEDEGYMDMTPMSQTIATTTSGELKPEPLSRRSSGTPSTDLCFTEYPLDKVRSYFTPSEDDEPMMVRAYSIGSRAECRDGGGGATSVRTSGKLDVVGAVAEASRTRAFSVGSKRANGKVSSKLVSGAALPISATTSSAVATSKSAFDERNKKSSSAPLLGSSPFSNSWSTGGTSSFAHHKMYSAAGASGSGGRSTARNEDLMEMDFPGSSNGNYTLAGNNRPRTNSRSSHGRPAKMDTQLQSIGEKTNCVSTLTSASSTSGDAMNGGSRLTAAMMTPSNARLSDYADMSAMSASTKVTAVFGKPRPGECASEGGVVDRKGHVRGGAYQRNSVGSSDSVGGAGRPTKPVSRLSAQLNSTDYVDMNMARKEAAAETVPRKESTSLSPVTRRGSTSPIKATGGGSDDYQLMARPGSSPGSGEYVNIDPSVRQMSRSPAPFDMLPLTSASTTAATLSSSTAATQPRKAWTLSGSIQSPKLEDASMLTSSSSKSSAATTRRVNSSTLVGPAATSSPTTAPLLTSSALIADAAAKHNPEYANLQFGRRGEHDHPRVSPAAISSPIPVGGAGGNLRRQDHPSLAPDNRPSDSDYAFMSPQVIHAAGVETIAANQNGPAYTVSALRQGDGESWRVLGQPSTATVAPPSVGVAFKIEVVTSPADVVVAAPSLLGGTISAPPPEPLVPVANAGHLPLPASSSSSSDLSAAAGSDVSDSAVFVSSEPVSPAKRGSADGGTWGGVQSSPSRPASVSSERELNYASLDLAPAVAVPEETAAARVGGDGAETDAGVGGPPTYAQIDFSKSEGLRAATSAVSTDRQNRV